MSATTLYRVTVRGHSVGSSPTYPGMLAIAGIFSACRIGHTIHTPSTYAHSMRHVFPEIATPRETVAVPLDPWPWLTDEQHAAKREQRAFEAWTS